MAVSGKCYLSLHEMNSSANRGHAPRYAMRSYTVTDRETGDQLDIENQYIMSPKDLCTIGFLDRLADAGVRVLKIEGRARGPNTWPPWSVPTTARCARCAARESTTGRWSTL